MPSDIDVVLPGSVASHELLMSFGLVQMMYEKTPPSDGSPSSWLPHVSDRGVGYVVRVARAQDVRVVVGERSGAERAVACIVACHADAAAAVRVPYGECVLECAGPAEAVGAAALVVVGP